MTRSGPSPVDASREVRAPSIEDEVTWYLSPGHPRRGPINADPFSFFDRLRDHDPVHKSTLGPWILTRYDDVVALLASPHFTRDVRAQRLATLAPGAPTNARPALGLIESGMLWRDPPDHTRLRRLVTRSFSPRVVDQWIPRMEEIVRRTLDDLGDRATFDLLHDFAIRLPGTVMTEMIGMPADRFDDYARWSDAVVTVQDPGSTQDELEAADRSAAECLSYFDELAEEKRRHPRDDVLSMLVSHHGADPPATRDEIVGMCVLLHVAGHETTSNLIANGMYHLMRDPDQYHLMRSRPELAPNAVEEILRFDVSSPTTTPRWAVRDTEIGGHTIPEGDCVIGVFGAANRDPSRFCEPHRFDITRQDNAHVAFGFGIHFCLGARLARAETAVALSALARDYPELVLAGDEPTWRDMFILRALDQLPVAWVA